MNLKQAAQLALEYIEQNAIISGIPIRDALRAALTDDAMQRLPDVQQEMEDHFRDATKMVATNEMETVEPVAYVTGYSKGRCIIEAVDPAWLLPVGMALYRSPPTINGMETVERAHGIVVKK